MTVPGHGASPFTSRELLPQEEKIAIRHSGKKPTIGVPKESSKNEHRVGLIPHSVRILVSRGHRVLIERNAGLRSNYSDHEYS